MRQFSVDGIKFRRWWGGRQKMREHGRWSRAGCIDVGREFADCGKTGIEGW
jgi:hypothetical protein